MVFEVLKNAMQATVDKHLDEQDVLPEIKVILFSSMPRKRKATQVL